MGQIIVFPKASRELEKYAIDELTNYKKQIDAKIISFEQAAKRYSEDPGSKDKGGMYQINRNEKTWDPLFMAAAFRLKDGEISPIVKTQFGYHLIHMVPAINLALTESSLAMPALSSSSVTGGRRRMWRMMASSPWR